MSGAAQKSKRERRTRLPDGLLKRPADDADLRCEDLGDGSFHTVGVGEAVVAEAALDLDAGAPNEGGEVRHPVALEGRYRMPCGLADHFARAVLENVVGSDGEACHLGVADVLDAGIPDDAAEGNLIELFHNVIEIKGLLNYF